MSKPTYILNGEKFRTLEEFYDEVTRVLSPPSWWGRNLDAFNDILRPDFMPEQGYIIVWKHSDLSKQYLDYKETIRQLSKRLEKCHPSNIPWVQKELEDAKRHEGPTVFDWLVEIIHAHCKGGDEEDDNGELILE